MEWISNCFFLTSEQFFSSMTRTSYIWWDDDYVCYVLDQHAELDFYSTSPLIQQFASKHVAPLGQKKMNLCQPILLSLLNAACLAEKQQINNFLVWSHDLPHSRWACQQLHHRSCVTKDGRIVVIFTCECNIPNSFVFLYKCITLLSGFWLLSYLFNLSNQLIYNKQIFKIF